MSYFYNFNRKEMSSEEIASRMDFGEVLSNYKIVTKPFYKTGWFASVTTLTIAGTVALLMLMPPSSTNDSETKTTAANDKTVTYKEDSPCIKPPQKNADLPFESYQIENSTGGTFIHHSGSEINIPANSFTQNGVPVEGKVEIRYREFRDQADFILSGIPMTYDSSGKEYHFESAGMLEIRAFKNDQPVDFKGEIEVKFASDYNGTEYNFYQLDEKKNNWTSLGKDEVLPMESSPNNSSSISNNELANSSANLKEVKKTETRLAEVKQEIKEMKSNVPDAPNALDKRNFNFTLDVLAADFPELSAFSTTRFEVSPKDKNFNSKLFESEWTDIKLKEDPKTGNLKMTLAKGATSKTFEVYPVYEGTDYKAKKEKFDKEFKEYSYLLDSREKEEIKLESYLTELRTQSKKSSSELSEQWAEKRRKNNSSLMPAEGEHEMLMGRIDNAKNNNIRVVTGLVSNGEYQYDRKLKLPSMGVFNCDSPVSLPIAKKGKKHRFQFKNKDGISLGMMIIYVLEKKRNVMFTYQPEDFESIRMSDEGENTIVGITTSGAIAVAVPTDLKMLDWDENILDVNMRVFESIKDPNELRNILNPVKS